MNRVWRASADPALRSVVTSFSYREIAVDEPVRRPLPARPLHFLEFYLDRRLTLVDWTSGERFAPPGDVVVVGHQTRRVCDIEIFGRYRVFTMHLVPSGLYRLCGLPMESLTNTSVDAGDFFPGAGELRERLGEAVDLRECVTLAERFIAQRLDKAAAWTHVDGAAIRIRDRPGDMRAVVAASGLSTRQFERRFLRAVGMTPSTFARVSRFYQAIERKENAPALRWTDVAADLGYYDQAHFARDARELGGEAAGIIVDRISAVAETSGSITSHFS